MEVGSEDDDEALASLPPSIRAIVEEQRRTSEDAEGEEDNTSWGSQLCQAGPEEGTQLKLKWMRLPFVETDEEVRGLTGLDDGELVPAVFGLHTAVLVAPAFIVPPAPCERVTTTTASTPGIATRKRPSGGASAGGEAVVESALAAFCSDLQKVLAIPAAGEESMGRGSERNGVLYQSQSKTNVAVPLSLFPLPLTRRARELQAYEWTVCFDEERRHLDVSTLDWHLLAAFIHHCQSQSLADALLLRGLVLPHALKALEQPRQQQRQRQQHQKTGVLAVARALAWTTSLVHEPPEALRAHVRKLALRALGPLGEEVELVLAEALFEAALDHASPTD